jgi:hemerythrin-like metal-binding protein
MHLELTSDDLLADMEREHRQIAERAAVVRAAVAANRQDEVTSALAALARAMADHFSAEEKAMERFGYDGLAGHRDDHDTLATSLGAIRLALLTETLAHLESGLADYVALAARHIAEHDGPLRAFLAGRG